MLIKCGNEIVDFGGKKTFAKDFFLLKILQLLTEMVSISIFNE